ncbi:hypothetical protein C5167_040783 [Papaver somniferum]|uniref:F-box domain-containing protein n=1 Tax=Papaver somniferum TaxID=3469 RepID=A0A4Y7IJE7_PAPSO|nr:hypothetical protein C5167_040783 [Papaver somniferum]
MGTRKLVNRNRNRDNTRSSSSTPDFVLTWGKRKRVRAKSTSSSQPPPSRGQTEPIKSSSFVLQWGRKKRLRCRKVATATEHVTAAILSFIPDDIILDILTRLPVKSLLRFRCVCKFWYELLKTSNFAELHLNLSLKYGYDGIVYNHVGKISCVDYDSLVSSTTLASTLSNMVAHIDYPLEHRMERILGTCNGLVCYLTSQKDIIIWNPCTKDYKQIPTPPEIINTKSRGIHVLYKYGFGYDLKTEDYKVARIANIRDKYSEIAVYSLKLNLWKMYGDIPVRSPYEDLVLFEGIFHWVELPPSGSQRPRMIFSFDTGSQILNRIPLPQHFSDKFNMIHVRLLGGCLYLIGSLYMTCSEAWMMRDYGVHESWTKMFSIDNTKYTGLTHLDIRQYYRNGLILVHEAHFYTYLYNLNHDEAIKLKVVDGAKDLVVISVPSLVHVLLCNLLVLSMLESEL